jgi:hypothetical protein
MNDLASIATQINTLHRIIEDSLRQSVQDAIRVGRLLSEMKDNLKHGDFLPWVKLNCRFSERTAYNYIALHQHQNKIATVANLQEAYRQIETIEAQEKQTEAQQARQRVDTFNKTGQKPEGWRRGTDDKLAEEEKAQAEKVKQIKREIEQETATREKPEPYSWDGHTGKPSQALRHDIEQMTKQIAARQDFKERIRVSHEGKDDPFVDAIMDYLDGLPDDSRRIEACYNVIKVCKGIANQLQRGTP